MVSMSFFSLTMKSKKTEKLLITEDLSEQRKLPVFYRQSMGTVTSWLVGGHLSSLCL